MLSPSDRDWLFDRLSRVGLVACYAKTVFELGREIDILTEILKDLLEEITDHEDND